MSCVERTKPLELKNHLTGQVFYDRLYTQGINPGPCSSTKACTGSTLAPAVVKSTYVRPKQEILQQAKVFIEEFYDLQKMRNSEEHLQRWVQVQHDIESRGTYQLSFDELATGARLAWRNAPRCIGRIQWTNLQVKDARHVRTPKEMFECLLEHIKSATNDGKIRSTVTVFPQRTNPKFDFRIWNSQLIGYAGYKNADGTVTGDPAHVEITELCLKLGWVGKGTPFDVLPLVLQANGQDPELFIIPDSLVLQVDLTHPSFPWFEELGLRWYALPAVSNMLFDIGGICFPAAPFNGWYMGTEIGARDLCDAHRYNLAEIIGHRMGLDTGSPSTLWKDSVILEVNRAVLYSYQKKGVTIWDHHTATETFMQFFGNEMRVRGGCPADWIWLTPPMSSSACPVFHQEMAFYFLKPSFEYQEGPLKSSTFPGNSCEIRPRNMKFSVVARMVLFCSSLFVRVTQKRLQITVLYASESGKSEMFASRVASTLSHQFKAQVKCMCDYEASQLNQEKALVVVTSTFGNGEPPTNGTSFREQLLSLQSNSSFVINDHSPPRFAVFALGSSAYAHYCSFGKFIDRILSEIGFKPLLPVCCGDELNGQESSFLLWLKRVSTVLCKEFLEMDPTRMLEFTGSLNRSSAVLARFLTVNAKEDLVASLNQVHDRSISLARIAGKTTVSSLDKDHSVVLIRLNTFGSRKMIYQPGDHLAVYPRNSENAVNIVLSRLKACPNENAIVQLQSKNNQNNWEMYHKIPPCSFRTLLSRFINLNAPPSQAILRVLAAASTDSEQSERLQHLAEDKCSYDEWVREYCPTVPKILKDLPCIEADAATILSTMPLIRPRLFSISSSTAVYPLEIHLTVTCVQKFGDEGLLHQGLCSSYLAEISNGEIIFCYHQPAPYFHLPIDTLRPILMICTGSGIGPFRGFWLEREGQRNRKPGLSVRRDRLNASIVNSIQYPNQQPVNYGGCKQYGALFLYYGCREKSLLLYGKEISVFTECGLIAKSYVAISRQPNRRKVYVQDLLWRNGSQICRQILEQGAHIFVCGGANASTQIEETLKKIIAHFGKLNEDQTRYIFQTLQDDERYHLDVF